MKFFCRWCGNYKDAALIEGKYPYRNGRKVLMANRCIPCVQAAQKAAKKRTSPRQEELNKRRYVDGSILKILGVVE